MFQTSDASEPVHPSATVVLVRDGARGVEVLLVQRNRAVKHMGGMWVFPGGKVEEGDYPDDGDHYRAAVNAAIRETREEAGVSVSHDQLVHLSHWTTPRGAKRRFATWFFLAMLEEGQEIAVDGGEIACHRWVRPEDALAESADEAHELRLMPPTYVSLSDLVGCRDCEDARRRMAGREPFAYAPRMLFVEDGVCFLYGGDAGYETEELEAAGPRHRLYMVNDQLEYLRDL